MCVGPARPHTCARLPGGLYNIALVVGWQEPAVLK